MTQSDREWDGYLPMIDNVDHVSMAMMMIMVSSPDFRNGDLVIMVSSLQLFQFRSTGLIPCEHFTRIESTAPIRGMIESQIVMSGFSGADFKAT